MFTFSFSLAHAILLLLEALSFIIFPKVIGKLSSKDNEEVKSTISMLRTIYITSAHLLIYFAMILFPILLYFMPKYSPAITSLNLIALSILMSSSSYGYLELMISKNKEKEMALLSATALVINCVLALILVHGLHVEFSYVIIATMITYSLFTISVMYRSESIVGKKSFKELLIEWFPLRLVIPYLIAIILSLAKVEQFIFIPLLIALVCNWRQILEIKSIAMKLLYKPDSVNLK